MFNIGINLECVTHLFLCFFCHFKRWKHNRIILTRICNHFWRIHSLFNRTNFRLKKRQQFYSKIKRTNDFNIISWLLIWAVISNVIFKISTILTLLFLINLFLTEHTIVFDGNKCFVLNNKHHRLIATFIRNEKCE